MARPKGESKSKAERQGPSGDLKPWLQRLLDSGIISHLDYYLALAVGQVFPKSSDLTLISCALVSRALGEGHLCLNLEEMAGKTLTADHGEGPGFRLPGIDPWLLDLGRADCLAKETDQDPAQADWVARYPLVLDSAHNLYLSKYYNFEQRLILNLAGRLGPGKWGMDNEFIQKGLDRYFGDQDPVATLGQRLAVQKALEGRFLLISGGPGTGKTHVTKIIRALVEDWAEKKGLPNPRVTMAAPTGKAAARLIQGKTLHALLKPKTDGVGFIHGKGREIQADLVIVDEASMIDLALMARLFEAVPKDARLILLGDRNQLSPVQAGAVFTDLCAVPALDPFRAVLDHNFRSQGKSGIDALARAVNANDVPALVKVLTGKAHPDVRFEDLGNKSWDPGIIEKYLHEGYQALSEATTPEQALDRMDRFRVLCAHNRGDAGTLQVNHLCEKILRSGGLGGIKNSLCKQLVMVTRNDYGKELFNGDTGVVVEAGGTLKAWFRKEGGGIRTWRVSDLPTHEGAFAVTVHKSQGSEFDSVLILVPDRLSQVLTRQLLYTGVTRARTRVIIAGSLKVICQAMAAPVQKRSNLADKLSQRLAPL